MLRGCVHCLAATSPSCRGKLLGRRPWPSRQRLLTRAIVRDGLSYVVTQHPLRGKHACQVPDVHSGSNRPLPGVSVDQRCLCGAQEIPQDCLAFTCIGCFEQFGRRILQWCASPDAGPWPSSFHCSWIQAAGRLPNHVAHEIWPTQLPDGGGWQLVCVECLAQFEP